MPITKDNKFLIKKLFMLEGYNAKQLVRELPSNGWNVNSVYKLLQKLGVTLSVDPHPDNTVPAQLITLTLFRNWCYTKMARQEVIFAHNT